MANAAPSVRRRRDELALGLAVTAETRARLLALGTKRVELSVRWGSTVTTTTHLSRMPAPDAERLRFISMGRLLHWKGFHLGLKAFAAAALPQAEYWIVGDGPERAYCQTWSASLGVEDRVRFRGSLSRPTLSRSWQPAHVLVHPSLHDSGGWVCLEAMAAGKPVICLDLGGPAEQVTERTGVKVSRHNPQQAVC